MDELVVMFSERPYVVAFLASFLVIAWAERGWQRTLFWLASGTFIGWLAEFSSIRNGFPFGGYEYHESNFPDEAWIGGVPLFASLSFAFLTYFGYSVACTLLSPLERRGRDFQRKVDPSIDGSLRVLLLAAIITTWVDTVIDPVSHLGRYWFLGDLYAYDGDGIHLGVPLSNYGGWLFTGACIVLVNQLFDALLRFRGAAARGFALPYKPFWALGTVFGNFAFMIAVAGYLTLSDSGLASGLALSAAFTLVAAIALRRNLERMPERHAAFAPAREATRP